MLELLQVPVWRDNYAYLVHDGRRAFVVDPPEANPILAALEARDLSLEAILNTHHHPDHVGGNLELVEQTRCEVIGPAHDRARIPAISRPIEVEERCTVAGVSLRVLDVRGHTRGHVAYQCVQPIDRVVRHGHDGHAARVSRLEGRPALFVGDSLFLGGCGRLFEGTPKDLAAVMQIYRASASESLVCCAHEYTETNLRFAAHVLPSHGGIAARLATLEHERSPTGSSVPDTMEREFETNPFLLAFDAAWSEQIASSLDVPTGDIEQLLGALRSFKDRF